MAGSELHVSGSIPGLLTCESGHVPHPIDRLPVETTVTFFVLNYCQRHDIPILLHHSGDETSCERNNLKIGGQDVEISGEIPAKVAACTLPAVREGCLVRAGLCGVLRHIVKSSHFKRQDLDLIQLLGYKGICLKSCAEVSVWTKFCEVEMPGLVTRIQKNTGSPPEEIPEEILKLENHLQQPPIIANINKRRRQVKKATVSSESLEHVYAEGADMTLTDLILYPCVTAYLNFHKNSWSSLVKTIPRVIMWYRRMLALGSVEEARQKSGLPKLNLPEVAIPDTTPQLTQSHLDVRETNKKKHKAHGSQVASIMKKLSDMGVDPAERGHPCGENIKLPWEEFPSAVHPLEGNLPLSRVARKCEQLENLAQAVLSLAKEGQVIVDFCAGGGHLGILLAHLLPKCQIVLVENKEESLERGQKRVEQLGLSNVTLYQCNMDYYTGAFDIGVCLHACGVATDLVLQRCLDNRASFVICPCCYGSIRNTHTMSYPRSRLFSQKSIIYEDYLTLGHAADQTELGIKQASDGKSCMLLIDWDRATLATDHGYDVTLCSLKPLTCSPKNNLLIGKLKP